MQGVHGGQSTLRRLRAGNLFNSVQPRYVMAEAMYRS
jgi:hypothetical protein